MTECMMLSGGIVALMAVRSLVVFCMVIVGASGGCCCTMMMIVENWFQVAGADVLW
jgi:hypothetical protein